MYVFKTFNLLVKTFKYMVKVIENFMFFFYLWAK